MEEKERPSLLFLNSCQIKLSSIVKFISLIKYNFQKKSSALTKGINFHQRNSPVPLHISIISTDSAIPCQEVIIRWTLIETLIILYDVCDAVISMFDVYKVNTISHAYVRDL